VAHGGELPPACRSCCASDKWQFHLPTTDEVAKPNG
jgi:hypothetical protein